jgi:flagellar biogenesis protein FliO
MYELQQVFGVLIVLGLLGATLWWLRRRGLAHVAGLPSRRRASVLESVERLPLSATHMLHLVRVADRAVLLATSPGGCQVVESAPWSQFKSRAAGGGQS